MRSLPHLSSSNSNIDSPADLSSAEIMKPGADFHSLITARAYFPMHLYKHHPSGSYSMCKQVSVNLNYDRVQIICTLKFIVFTYRVT